MFVKIELKANKTKRVITAKTSLTSDGWMSKLSVQRHVIIGCDDVIISTIALRRHIVGMKIIVIT